MSKEEIEKIVIEEYERLYAYYCRKATSPSEYSRMVAPEQGEAITSLKDDILRAIRIRFRNEQ